MNTKQLYDKVGREQNATDLSQLKALTLDQHEQCRVKTLERVQQRIGQRPTRAQFKRELAPLVSVLDAIALVVFAAALVVSSVHIIQHMGKLAAASYGAIAQSSAGTIINLDFYVAVHQWGFIALSEGAMILFQVMFGLSKEGWRRWVFFVLSMAALLFVFVANWQSGIGILESVLAPVFTVGIGLKFEHLLVQMFKRRADIDRQYLDALAVYEASSQDATQHPDYLPLLKQEIWQRLVSLSSNKAFREAPPAFKLQAANRELERDTWAYGLTGKPAPAYAAIAAPVTSNEQGTADFLAMIPLSSNGNGTGH